MHIIIHSEILSIQAEKKVIRSVNRKQLKPESLHSKPSQSVLGDEGTLE